MFRNLSPGVRVCRAILSLFLCSEIRRDPCRAKFSSPDVVSPSGEHLSRRTTSLSCRAKPRRLLLSDFQFAIHALDPISAMRDSSTPLGMTKIGPRYDPREEDVDLNRRAVWPVRSRFPAPGRLIFSGHSFGRPHKDRRAGRKFPEALVRANESVVRPASLVGLSNAQLFRALAPLVR